MKRNCSNVPQALSNEFLIDLVEIGGKFGKNRLIVFPIQHKHQKFKLFGFYIEGVIVLAVEATKVLFKNFRVFFNNEINIS
jgi:hypothetical protein